MTTDNIMSVNKQLRLRIKQNKKAKRIKQWKHRTVVVKKHSQAFMMYVYVYKNDI